MATPSKPSKSDKPPAPIAPMAADRILDIHDLDVSVWATQRIWPQMVLLTLWRLDWAWCSMLTQLHSSRHLHFSCRVCMFTYWAICRSHPWFYLGHHIRRGRSQVERVRWFRAWLTEERARIWKGLFQFIFVVGLRHWVRFGCITN